MTEGRCLYLFESRRPASWGDDVGTVDPMPTGMGLTDMRFDHGGNLGEYFLTYDRPEFRPSTSVGQYLPSEFADLWKTPVQVKLFEGRAKHRRFPDEIHDIYRTKTCICVSGRVREIIERIEPRRHQFIPAKFVAWDTGEDLFADQEMHVLNVLNWVAPDQLFDLSAMSAVVSENGREKFGEPISFRISDNVPPAAYRIRTEWLDAGHLIITGGYKPRRSLMWNAPVRIFMSEELHGALKRDLPAGAIHDVRIPVTEPGAYWQMVLRQKADQTK